MSEINHSVHSEHHHHHHHHHATGADIYKNRTLSAQKRKKILDVVMTVFLTLVCIAMLAYIYWLYSNE